MSKRAIHGWERGNFLADDLTPHWQPWLTIQQNLLLSNSIHWNPILSYPQTDWTHYDNKTGRSLLIAFFQIDLAFSLFCFDQKVFPGCRLHLIFCTKLISPSVDVYSDLSICALDCIRGPPKEGRYREIHPLTDFVKYAYLCLKNQTSTFVMKITPYSLELHSCN